MITAEVAAPFRIQLSSLGGYVKVGTTSKKEALAVACPKCSSAPGDGCVQDNVARRALHIERHHRAIELGARIRFIGGAMIFYDD